MLQRSVYIHTDCTDLVFHSCSTRSSVPGSRSRLEQGVWRAVDMGSEHVVQSSCCLLADITSLNLAVSLTEPRALRLSGKETRGGECIDSNTEGRQTRQQLKQTAGAKEAQLIDGRKNNSAGLCMTFIWRLYLVLADAPTNRKANHIRYVTLSQLIVLICTWVMQTYLEITDQIPKAYCHPRHKCLRAWFSAAMVYLEICRQFQP